MEIKPFYIGQEVVAIVDHSAGNFKKGDEFVVKGFSECKGDLCIFIGLTPPPGYKGWRCARCGMIGNEMHYYATSFRPKLEIGEFLALSEVVKLELFAVN